MIDKILLSQETYSKDESIVKAKSWVACMHGHTVDEPHIAVLPRCFHLVPAGDVLDSLKGFALGGTHE